MQGKIYWNFCSDHKRYVDFKNIISSSLRSKLLLYSFHELQRHSEEDVLLLIHKIQVSFSFHLILTIIYFSLSLSLQHFAIQAIEEIPNKIQ